MKTAYIFHDAFSNPREEWYPWMKTTLEGFGYHAIVPEFPTPAGQTLDSWRAVVKNFLPTFDEETVLIGHGTGALLAFRLLESLESAKQIRGLYSIAGYGEKIGHAGFDRVNETFLAGDFKWETIRSRAMTIAAFSGDDDPFVPRDASERLAKNLDVQLQIISSGGHVTKASGFSQFIQLASAIKELQNAIAPAITAEVATPVSIPDSNSRESTNGLAQPIAGLEFDAQRPDVPIPGDSSGSSESSDISPKPEVSVAPSENIPKSPHAPEAIPIPVKSGVHTMYQDMGTLVDSNRGTVASAMLTQAREEKREKRESSPTSPKNMLYFFGALIIVIAAIGIIGYLVYQYAPANQVAVAPQVPSLIQADHHTQINLTGQSYTIESAIRAALTVADPSSITDIFYVKNSAFATLADTFTSLGITDVPSDMESQFATGVSASQPLFMHGAGSVNGKPAHFMIIPVNDYDSAFAATREWEPTMFRDLGIFMDVPADFLKTKLTRDTFHDELINNRPMRVLDYQPPASIDLDETPSAPTSTSVAITPISYAQLAAQTATSTAPLPDISDFTNPLVNPPSPYQAGDLMLAYFFLNEHAIVITDNTDIIPEILTRYANAQIYGN